MQNWKLLAVLFAASLLGCESAGRSGDMCTLIGCIDGLSIDFTRTSWPVGSYSVQVIQDGKPAATCMAKLPFEPSGSAGQCDATNLTLGTSGQALPASQQALTGLRINGTPTKVQIVMLRNGALELSTEVTPTYQTSTPNGAKCGPTCTQSHVKIAIP